MTRPKRDGDTTKASAPPESSVWSLVDGTLAVFAVLLALASLATAWLRFDGAVGMLWSLHGPLEAAGVVVAPYPAAVRLYALAPVLLVVLGIASIVAPALRRVSAWLLFAIGTAMVASALFPPILIGLRSTVASGSRAALLACGPGILLFAASGVVMLAIASRRLDQTDYDAATSWRGFWAVLGCVALIFLLFGGLLAAFPSGGGVRFTAEATPDGVVTIACENLERRSVAISVPWPSGGPGVALEELRLPRFGFSLEARAPDQTEFELVVDPGQAFSARGRALRPFELVPLDPGAELEVVLDPDALQEVAGPLDAVRLVFSDQRGRRLAEFATAIPHPSPSREELPQVGAEPASTEMPSSEPYAPAEPEPPSEVALPASPATPPPPAAPPSPESVAPESVAPAAPAPSGPTVRVRAVVGSRLAFTVRMAPDGRAERTLAGVGDEVAPGWVLRSLDPQEPSAVLSHSATGALITVDAKSDTELKVEE